MLHFKVFKCSQCKYVYDIWFSNFSTRIGPGYVRCRKCQTVNESGRLEWPEFTTKTKIVTALICLGYLGIGSYVVGEQFYITKMGKKSIPFPELSREIILPYFMAGFIFIFAILLMKFIQSYRRFNTDPDKPSDDGLFTPSLTFGTQLKFFLLMMLYFLIYR